MDLKQVPPVMLYYHPSTKTLAEKIVAIVNKKPVGSHENIRSIKICDGIRWNRFRDGWPDIFIDNVKEIAGKDVIFVASFHSPEVIFEQLSLIYAFPRYLVRSFRLILPYFPTGTMERIDTEGQVVTAKSLARMLSLIPLAARGPAQIFIFDIHALQERFYFTDEVIPRLLSAVPYLIRELKNLPDINNLAIAFPDEGAYKRFHTLMEEWPIIICSKVRDGDKRIVKIKEGDPKGKHVIIIDDLVQTGGTLIECAKALKNEECSAVSIFVTHGVFPEKSWERFVQSEVEFSNIWVTDSIPHANEIVQNKPFKLLSLSEAIVDALLILKSS